ncbi:MAG: type IV secretion system DNA-binding domain-containing protein [Candidatus Pacebacteria bacterium]|nr:type IV secretion system DNA-binding domain-containing protein [Candidatus Paceibacterota bacterium]
MSANEYALARPQAHGSTADLVASEFSRWLALGQGTREWDFPVFIEPPYSPIIVAPAVIEDDGRQPTILSALADTVGNWLSPKKRPAPKANTVVAGDLNWLAFPNCSTPVEFQALIPPHISIRKDSFEQFLMSVRYCHFPLCFELIGRADSITVQLVAQQDDVAHVEPQLAAHFPDIVFAKRTGHLEKVWQETEGEHRFLFGFSLLQPFLLPLESYRGFPVDPLVGLAGALSDIRKDEAAVFQVLFEPARNPWLETLAQVAEFAPELSPHIRKKIAYPFFAVVARLACKAASEERLVQLLKNLDGAMRVFSTPAGNGLTVLSNKGYSSGRQEIDLLLRQTHRSGMLLNSDELLGLAHWPTPAVRTPKLDRATRKTRPAPTLCLNHALTLGTNNHNGEDSTVTLAPAQRVKHMHVVGASGTGKSTFLLNLIIQDIENGEGVGVLDPHGDLVDEILAHIPAERHDDVVLVDPSDEEYPVGFNILSAHSNLEKNLLASDLVSVFRRLSTSWGDQMTSVLGNAVLSFLESSTGGTLSDLRRFLIEPGFRAEFLETVRDEEVVYFWKKEFPLLSGKPQASLLTRLDSFLRPKPIRHMVCQKENKLDFASIMDSKKIFLAKLSQGLIGQENSYLLGSLFVSKFHQLVMGRQEVRQSERENFWLYLDEFQNFVTPSMAAILSGARKYRLGLILSHQDMHQLVSRDPDVANAVLANAFTRVCFRLGDSDARRMTEGFSNFDAHDLQSLGTGDAICRIERSAFDFNMYTALPELVDEELAEERRRRIREFSRAKHSKRRTELEPPRGQTPAAPAFPKAEDTTPTPAAPRPEPAPLQIAKSTPGKGGHEHKVFQQVLCDWAGDLGFTAAIEQELPSGQGSVDVEIETGSESIACEISVTTSIADELSNLTKCLTAGYDHLLMICTDRGKLDALKRSAAAKFPADALERVQFVTPTEAFQFLHSLIDGVSITAKGALSSYGCDVRVNYPPAASAPSSKKGGVAQAVRNATKRLRDGRK